MVLPPLDAAARQRMRRFLGALALLWYTRKTVRSLHENHAQLGLQTAFQPGGHGAPGELTTRVLRYTFASQLVASMEYLIPLVKPILSLRIGRLLVWKGFGTVSDSSYGPHPRNTIDLYGLGDPHGSSPRKPVLLFVHGGAWAFGHKWQYGLVGQYLATHGFLVGVINYRTYPTGNVQDQVADVEAAAKWIVEHAEQYGGDVQRVFLSGHSSGAHVSALALAQSAMRGTAQRAATGQITSHFLHEQIVGFIGLAGPYDIADHYVFEANRTVGPIHGVHEISCMKPAMLGEDKFDASSPTKLFRNINSNDVALPRFHILHGTGDEVVPASSSKRLVDSLRQSGHTAEYIELDACTHEDILFAAMGDNVASREELSAHYTRIARETPLKASALSIAPQPAKL